ncbi:MAG: beta-ketoacyl-ACP synthase II [Candidatus Omnitrophica bacterium]|nr:beta-ketoacyl-ACP synthase II [Candidatus Omnitrophota bacterium]
MKNRRVVVSGLGVLAPNGIGVKEFWQANVSGQSGIKRLTRFDTDQFQTKIAGQIDHFDPLDFMDESLAQKEDRFTQFALAAATLALQDSQIKLDQQDSYRLGVVLGSGLGGMFFYEKQILLMQQYGQVKTHPASIPRIMPNAPASQMAITFQCKGPNLTISTACASGNHAIGQALTMIKHHQADIILAGGTEAPLVFYNFAGFDAMRVMSRQNEDYQHACRPFDKNRDGFVMGEGAAILVLEEREHALHRGAKIYAEILGYGTSSGAGHMVLPVLNGEDAAWAMRLALENAEIRAEDIDYINAHGTSTQANDKAETQAIKSVFGKRAYQVPISATKSMIGHTLGAAGAIEAVVCCLAIENNIIPPTINYQQADAECDLDYVSGQARQQPVDCVLSNSFGFGNNNVTLIFGRDKP